jgi:hypothetical protein
VDRRERETQAILATGSEWSTNRDAARMITGLARSELDALEGEAAITEGTMEYLRIL